MALKANTTVDVTNTIAAGRYVCELTLNRETSAAIINSTERG